MATANRGLLPFPANDLPPVCENSHSYCENSHNYCEIKILAPALMLGVAFLVGDPRGEVSGRISPGAVKAGNGRQKNRRFHDTEPAGLKAK